MKKIATSACLLSALAVALIGCSSRSSKEPEENPNTFPADYKNEILLTMTSTLDDPTNVRGAFISEPVLRQAGKEQRYVICVRSDSAQCQQAIHREHGSHRLLLRWPSHSADRCDQRAMRQCRLQAFPRTGKALPGQKVRLVTACLALRAGCRLRLPSHQHRFGRNVAPEPAANSGASCLRSHR